MINTFILDDDVSVSESLQELLKEFCPEVNIAGHCQTIKDAFPFIKDSQLDLLFLDIDLGNEQSGFELLDALSSYPFEVIVISASEKHALRTFDYLSIAGYLLKPISFSKLITAVNNVGKVIAEKKAKLQSATLVQNDKKQIQNFILSDLTEIMLVPFADVIYIEGSGSYSSFCLTNGSTNKQSKHLKHYEDYLGDNTTFIRVHRTYLVNRHHIKSYLKEDWKIILSNKQQLPTTLTNKEFIKIISE